MGTRRIVTKGLLFLSLLVAAYPVLAEPLPPVTWFYGECVELVSQTEFRIHVNYTYGGDETYAFELTSAAPSLAYTNIPDTFQTSVNGGNGWFLDVAGADILQSYFLTFFNPVWSHEITLNTWDYPLCEDSLQPELPWAIDSSSGQPYHYEPLPDGSAPLPPPFGE